MSSTNKEIAKMNESQIVFYYFQKNETEKIN